MPDRIVHHGAMGQLLGDVEAAGSGEIVWWEVAEREIDLRSAAVRSIALHDVSGPLVLRVHPHTQSVFLAGDLRKVEIFGLEGKKSLCSCRVTSVPGCRVGWIP
ncbi:hypothetical protein ACFQ2K_44780 [Streptomyces sanglieri]|uniref:Uncharacterized protein n=1 Tax=Streptomyces sanglieri TaxID=193460 RepID=A0ABW2X4U3_9ACTN